MWIAAKQVVLMDKTKRCVFKNQTHDLNCKELSDAELGCFVIMPQNCKYNISFHFDEGSYNVNPTCAIQQLFIPVSVGIRIMHVCMWVWHHDLLLWYPLILIFALHLQVTLFCFIFHFFIFYFCLWKSYLKKIWTNVEPTNDGYSMILTDIKTRRQVTLFGMPKFSILCHEIINSKVEFTRTPPYYYVCKYIKVARKKFMLFL